MLSLIRHQIARSVAVGRVLVLITGVASRGNIKTPPAPWTDQARLASRAVAAAAGPTELAFEHSVYGATGVTTDIYRIRVDGTGLTRLTNAGTLNYNAAWSPDGSRIAFSSDRDGASDIYTMNADGSGQTRLTVGLDAWQPVWSPDGSKIVFSSFDGAALNVDIYVMNADGSHQVRLTRTAGGDFEPSWSPDSRRIAFSSQRNVGEEIYIINADGTGEHRLHADASLGSEQYPAWSPDGTRIAFTVIYSFGSEDIFVANADGSGVMQLAQGGEQPVWSPDGSKLVFQRISNCDDYGCYNSEIFSINADGSGATQLTFGRYDEEVAWSRDGSWIAFHEYICVSEYICAETVGASNEFLRLVRSDGSQLVDLVVGAASPTWKP